MGKLYLQKRGIRQGSPISVQLCNLYLGAMERERFGDILADPDSMLIRYVDDYLLVTTRKDLAENVRWCLLLSDLR